MATTYPVEQARAPLHLQHTSPLTTLVRRTSSKRARAAPQTQSPSSPQHATHLHDDYVDDTVDPSYTPEAIRRSLGDALPSPLLHSRFARNSTTGTASINGSYADTVGSRSVFQDLGYPYYDDDSVYSQADRPAIRDSWGSGTSDGTTRAENFGSMGPAAVPTVVVSSPDEDKALHGGRAAVVRPITSNFSRPVRPASHVSSQYATIEPPPLPQNSEEKRRVLERNANRATLLQQQERQQDDMRFFRKQNKSQQANNPVFTIDPFPISHPNPSSQSQVSNQHLRKGPAADATDHYRPPTTQQWDRDDPPSGHQHWERPPSQATPSVVPPRRPVVGKDPTTTSTVLSGQLPPRSDSRSSLYSTSYSYYSFGGSASPSPTDNTFSAPTTPPQQINHLQASQQQSDILQAPQRTDMPPQDQQLAPSDTRRTAKSDTPQDFLQLGIQSHEANRLRESAMYFEKSAKDDGGCGVGMLMWGLTLRHGWGCEKNEKVGFKWLRKAAESAVVDLESARVGMDTTPVQDELVLAIYEVGQCFFHGWGVPKDQKMAVSYYTVAARLGDADAQNDLGFCLANGKGCKKDRKEAAKWYRAAVKQGISDVGLAWIYKDKFM